ncbi:unnamed protein product [Amoebophrya sp. A25]|nr:unnamed protein product [Amoebophrya sp. A25]|eukprot:GSA25T00019156001.1
MFFLFRLSLAFALGTAIRSVEASVDCTALSSCGACYNASSWCHWCSSSTATSSIQPQLHLMAKHAAQQDQGQQEQQLQQFGAVPAGGSCHTIGTGCMVGSSCGDDNVNATCRAQPDCQTCTAASSLCHWCGDSCHVWGSPYGCAVGVSCMANTECKRKQPVFIGFAPAPDYVYIATFGLLAVFLSMAGCVQCICYRVYKSVQIARAEIEQSYEGTQLRSGVDEDARAVTVADEQDGRGPQRITALDPASTRPALWARIIDRLVSGCFRNTCCLCLILLPFLILGSIVFVVHYPREPVIDYCSKELEWSKLINNIETLVTEQVYADFEFLLSVYNPNRVDAHIDEVKARLYYPPGSTNLIGTVGLKNYTAAGGSVSDGLAVVSLAVERWSALDLAKQYALGQLKIEVRGEVSFALNAYGWKVVHTTVDLPLQVIDTAAPIDMTYCNCRDGPPSHRHQRRSDAKVNPFDDILDDEQRGSSISINDQDHDIYSW